MNFQKFETDGDSFEDVLAGALDVLEQKGLSGEPNEPMVSLIMKNDLLDKGNEPRRVSGILYIGGTEEEIINDLKPKDNEIKKKPSSFKSVI